MLTTLFFVCNLCHLYWPKNEWKLIFSSRFNGDSKLSQGLPIFNLTLVEVIIL